MVIVGSSVAGSLHHVMGVGSGVFGRSFHSTHGSKYTIQAGLMKFSASCCKLIPVYKSRSFCRVIPFSTSLPNTAYFGVKSPVPRAQSNDHIPISLTAVTPYGSGVGIHRNPTNNTHGHTRLEKTKTIKRSKLKQKACLVPRDIANTGTMIEELETFLDKNSKREVIREPHMFCPNLEKHFETEEEQQARKRSVVITNETRKMEGPSIKQSLSCSSQFDHRRNAVIKLVKDGGKVPLDNNTLKKNPSSRVMFVADTLSVAKCHERSIKLTVDRGTSASFRLQVPTVFSNVGNHCSPVLEPQYENFTNENCNVPSDLVNDASVDRVVKLSTVDNTVEAPLRNENPREEGGNYISDDRVGLSRLYDAVLVVDNVAVAKSVVKKLTEEYGSLVHACDTEVAEIDAKQETPVANGKLICFSIYSGQGADFGSGKTAIWVDILDGGKDVLMAFAPFFEDASIKKVWHNYSFDHHVLENHGIKPSGFHADTMHLARLWDSSRRTKGGYSLEALTGDPRVMSRSDSPGNGFVSSKISMKTIFGRRKLKKNGSEGKIVFVPSVEELQKKERIPWICYSVRDSISTLQLFVSLKKKLMDMYWVVDGVIMGTMYDFYVEYWCYFGEVLVKMESEGMLVDRKYLSEMEKIANKEQKIAAARFRKWASMYCRDALYMNVGSDVQLRQLFFGGTVNSKDSNESVPHTRTFKVPNVDYVDGENYKSVQKYRNIKLHLLKGAIPTEVYTPSGWPSISNDVLKTFSGKISANAYDTVADDFELNMGEADNVEQGVKSIDKVTGNESEYGTAYDAFGGGEEGKEACVAIASLCEMNSIHSLLSSFILPLQGKEIMGRKGRIHCSLNINTETGRLSSRRPNLQNQPALEKDRYRIRQAFIAEPGKSLIVADYGQLELRILAHLANCKSMIDAFKAGGDFHSRTAMNMYPYIREAVEDEKVLLEWTPKPDEDKPPVPLLKDIFASQRRKAKMLNFSIAYGKTPQGLARDWKVSLKEARDTVNLWYNERREVLQWQEERKIEAHRFCCVHTLLGRARRFPSLANASSALRSHIERAAINSPVQGSAADVAMCAMLEISNNSILKELGWKLIMQVHDEVILEGPTESEELAKRIVVECMSKPFRGTNFLRVDLSVDAECAPNWYAAK